MMLCCAGMVERISVPTTIVEVQLGRVDGPDFRVVLNLKRKPSVYAS